MMTIASRQSFWSHNQKCTVLEFIQAVNSGSGVSSYVDLGITPSDPDTEIYVEVCKADATAVRRLDVVWAGTDYDEGAGDGTNPQFGICAYETDRQCGIRVGKTRWWNSTSNSGNWQNDGAWHSLSMKVSGTSATCMKDGSSVAMANEGSTSNQSKELPTLSQYAFASHSASGPARFANELKIRRIKYALNGNDLADFYAAESKDGTAGFYDIVNDVFRPGTGTFVKGQAVGGGNDEQHRLNVISALAALIQCSWLHSSFLEKKEAA